MTGGRGKGRGRGKERVETSYAVPSPEPTPEQEEPEDLSHDATAESAETPAVSPVPPIPPTHGIDPAFLTAMFQAFHNLTQNMQPAQPAQPPVPAVPTAHDRWVSLSSQIIRRCPKEFKGNEGAVAAEEWLLDIKRHMEVLDCTPAEEIRLATYRMTGKAYTWWSTYVREVGRDHIASMTWEDFRAVFESKYVPEFSKLKMQEEYENLVQGTMTVDDYCQKFDDLSRYAPHETDTKQIERFKNGLAPYIQYKVGYMQFPTLLKAVECATAAESVCSRLCKDGNGKGKRKASRFKERSSGQKRDDTRDTDDRGKRQKTNLAAG